MAIVKAVLRKKLNKDGTYPLALRITKDRKSSYVYLGYDVQEKDWDKDAQKVKKSYPNSTRLNNFILAKRAEASDKTLEMETARKSVSSRAVKENIKPKGGLLFFGQAELYLAQLKKAGNYNEYTANKPRVKHFREFLGSDIAFADITTGLLEKFKNYLMADRVINDEVVKKVGERTAINHLVVIRSVFSFAIKNQVIDKKHYPFGKEGIVIKFPETTKVGISADDIVKLESVHLENKNYDHARNLWLISYYFAGMRISDVFRLRWSDFQELRLHYTMGKNKKAGSLKTPEKALRILEKYQINKTDDNDLIFPELKKLGPSNDQFSVKRTIAFATSRYDKFLRLHIAPLANIKGKLTMHISRHTFASLAGDKIPPQMLQKLYRHSSITTTIGYQANFIHKDADEALEAVIG